MRHPWIFAALALTAGCKPSLKGWWNLDSWAVSGGETYEDAGTVLWQSESSAADYGRAYVMLRYAWDPATASLAPNGDPGFSTTDWVFDEWTEDLPIELVIDPVDYTRVSLTVTDYAVTEMTLEGTSPYGDGATWTWEMSR